MSTIRIFRSYIKVPYFILGLLESIIFYFSLYAGAYVRFAGDTIVIDENIGDMMPKAAIYSLVMVSSMIAVGLYHSRLRDGMAGILLRIVISLLIGIVILSMFVYIVPEHFFGRGVLALALLFSFVGVGVMRFLFYGLPDQKLLKTRILVLGTGKRASCIQHLRRRSDQRAFHVVGFLALPDEDRVVDEKTILHTDRPLSEFVMNQEIDEIVVAVDDRRKWFPVDDLLDCKLRGIDVIDVLTFFEREVGKIQLDILDPSWLIFSDGFKTDLFQQANKKAFDILSSFLLLIVSTPVMSMTALAIWIEEGFGAPVFYCQVRVGLDGKLFTLYKFRSMPVNAEADGKAQWAQAGDDRHTRVGSFIRRVRIDEIPQVLNVLKGDMSIVGPRPERPEFTRDLAARIPYYHERHRVKPGITGWAQLCYPYGASIEDARKKLEYDLYYVKNQSLLMDALILLQTTEVIVWRKGGR